jgi:uncharacterized protein YecE (DUF72 family)
MAKPDFIIGTSGYSFADWVGPFYPPGTQGREMLGFYVQHFAGVEINFTFYRMPSEAAIAALAKASPPEFLFWVKANQALTHQGDPSGCGQFCQALEPMRQAGKLAGILLQFPQSFHRTVAERRYLADALESLGKLSPQTELAVEFRHGSWNHPSVLEGLRARGIVLAVPDVPELPGLFRIGPLATGRSGYLRLHSRDAAKWYAGMAQRYDYSYSQDQLQDLAAQWSSLEDKPGRVFAFFNNCHRGQAAANAQAFQRVVNAMK